MEDTLHCPICGNKLRTKYLSNKLLPSTDKKAKYIERSCTRGYNHSILFWVDDTTEQIDLIKLFFGTGITLTLNYIAQNTELLSIIKNNPYKIDRMKFAKIIEPDFPDLNDLKNNLMMYILFS